MYWVLMLSPVDGKSQLMTELDEMSEEDQAFVQINEDLMFKTYNEMSGAWEVMKIADKDQALQILNLYDGSAWLPISPT